MNNFSVLTYLTDITMTITIITFYYWNFILVHYIRLGLDSFWGYHHVSQQLYYLSDIRTSSRRKLLPINLSSLSLRSEGLHSSILVLMLFFFPQHWEYKILMMFVNQINLNWFSDTIIVFSNHWFFYLVNIALIKFGAHGSLEIDVKSESQMLLVWAPLWTLDVGRVLRQVSLSTLSFSLDA